MTQCTLGWAGGMLWSDVEWGALATWLETFFNSLVTMCWCADEQDFTSIVRKQDARKGSRETLQQYVRG